MYCCRHVVPCFLLLIFGSCTAQIPTDTDRHNASVWATVCTYCPYCPFVRLSVCPLLSLPQCSEFGRTPKFCPGQHVTDLLEWDDFLGSRDVGRHFHLLMRPGSFPALLRPQNVSIKYWKHFSGPGAAQFMTVAVGPQWRGQKRAFLADIATTNPPDWFLGNKTPLNCHELVSVYWNKPDLQLIAMLSLILASGPKEYGVRCSPATWLH